MNQESFTARRRGERGAASFKFLIVLALIAAAAYGGYQYVPVAYQASRFKVEMQDLVDKAATTGQTGEWLKTQLKASATEYGVPADAKIQVVKQDNRAQAQVQYTRPVSLLAYTYQYGFDHTAKSTELFNSK